MGSDGRCGNGDGGGGDTGVAHDEVTDLERSVGGV